MVSCLIDEIQWNAFKSRFWNRLLEDLEIGYLDRELIPILLVLNSDRNIYTLSSCSGRVVFSDSTYPWSREESSIIFKKHNTITVNEARDIIRVKTIRKLWLNVSGPIIHLSTKKSSYVKLLLTIARRAGLKHSGVLSVNRYKGYILEFMSGVKMNLLVKDKDTVLINEGKLEEIVEIVNEVFYEGRKLLNRLRNEVVNNLPIEVDQGVLKDINSRLSNYIELQELFKSKNLL